MLPDTVPPTPAGVRTYDELAERLRALRAWSGLPYRELHRRVVKARKARNIAELPAYDTVHRCFRAGRSRLDADLVVDIAAVLLDGSERTGEWRQACQVIESRCGDAAIVTVAGALPADLSGFTGRRPELERLLGAIDGGARTILIEGMAGVGKTKLAIRAAHQLVTAGRFADLQLSADLRGYDADRPAADPGAVLEAFLRQLGVPGTAIAHLDRAARTARLRELLAGRPTLIMLDNAGSEDQVRPLLPDDPSCLVLVTSRRRLTGLTTGRRLRLDAFSGAEALELLRQAAGPERVDTDLDTAGRITGLVGHLPLALGLVASRIRSYPDWSLTDHLERLTDRRDSLRLDDGVEVALTASYVDLPAGQQRMLRALALHPGRDFDACAAAAVAGTGLAEAEAALTGLVAGNLLQQRRAGRYEFHDLVRIFAAATARENDPAGARRAATDRLFRHYHQLAAAAMDRYAPQDAGRRPRVEPSGTPGPQFADPAAAVEWLDTERGNLVVTAMRAGESGAASLAAGLSITLFRYLDTRAHYRDAVILHRSAARVAEGADRGRVMTNLGVALQRLGRFPEALEWYRSALAIHRRLGNRAGEGSACGNLGVACALLGRYPEALDQLRQAVTIHCATGNRAGLATASGNLGGVLERIGRPDDALVHHRRYLAISRQIGYRAGEGKALGNLGRVRCQQGRYDEALDLHTEALAIARETGYREGEAEILNDTAATLRRAGRLTAAAEYHQGALGIAIDVGSQYERARAHDGLAHCLSAAGDDDAAHRHWRAALSLHERLGTPEAAEIERRLRSHPRRATGQFSPGSGSKSPSIQAVAGSNTGGPSAG